MKLMTTRCVHGEVRAYKISKGITGLLGSVATYRVQAGDKILHHAVAPDLGRAAYTTRNSVVCIDQEGNLLWRYNPTTRVQNCLHSPNCNFSLDGTVLWVYRASGIGPEDHDVWEVLRADTGEVVAQADLGTVGVGGEHFLHPNGRHILLDVGEGQDGVNIFRGAFSGDHIDLHSYGWSDRCLVDLAPDGRLFLTVDHDQKDAAFHNFPDGEVVLRISVAPFGYDPEEACIDWYGGFLDSEVAVIAIIGWTDEEEWRYHHRVDLRTGAPLGRFEATFRTEDDLEFLGDGTWIASDPNGIPIRYQLPGLRAA